MPFVSPLCDAEVMSRKSGIVIRFAIVMADLAFDQKHCPGNSVVPTIDTSMNKLHTPQAGVCANNLALQIVLF